MLADICPDLNSFDDIKRFLSEMKFDSCFEKITEKVKWTRWGSHQTGMVKLLLVGGKTLLVCVVIAMVTGVRLSAETLATLGLLEQPKIKPQVVVKSQC